METSLYKYGTTSADKGERHEIKFVRNCAKRCLDGEDTVYITQHALKRSSERKILTDDAIEIISEKYFIEFQPVRSEKQDPRVLFYSGHEKEIIVVNTLQDIHQQKITLITVEHKDSKLWRTKDDYIERI